VLVFFFYENEKKPYPFLEIRWQSSFN